MRTRAFACGPCADRSAWLWTRVERASATCWRTSALSLPAGAQGQVHTLQAAQATAWGIELKHSADPFAKELITHAENIVPGVQCSGS